MSQEPIRRAEDHREHRRRRVDRPGLDILVMVLAFAAALAIVVLVF